jgi:hypothetical protein
VVIAPAAGSLYGAPLWVVSVKIRKFGSRGFAYLLTLCKSNGRAAAPQSQYRYLTPRRRRQTSDLPTNELRLRNATQRTPTAQANVKFTMSVRGLWDVRACSPILAIALLTSHFSAIDLMPAAEQKSLAQFAIDGYDAGRLVVGIDARCVPF